MVAVALPDIRAEFSLSHAAVAWLNLVTPIIPADKLDERVVLAEAYDRLGDTFKKTELIEKSSALYSQIADDPKAKELAGNQQKVLDQLEKMPASAGRERRNATS